MTKNDNLYFTVDVGVNISLSNVQLRFIILMTMTEMNKYEKDKSIKLS